LKEYRCKFCHKLLFKAMFVGDQLEIVCGKCKKLNVFIKAAGGYDSNVNLDYKGNTFIA